MIMTPSPIETAPFEEFFKIHTSLGFTHAQTIVAFDYYFLKQYCFAAPGHLIMGEPVNRLTFREGEPDAWFIYFALTTSGNPLNVFSQYMPGVCRYLPYVGFCRSLKGHTAIKYYHTNTLKKWVEARLPFRP
jgi:hypothetical protein